MIALLDACVVVDALQNREPFLKSAQKILRLCSLRQCAGTITAKSLTDIYCLTHKLTHNSQLSRLVSIKLCTLLDLLDSEAIDVRQALTSSTSDFKDAVMIETAKRVCLGIDPVSSKSAL